MPKRIRPARHYARQDSPILKLVREHRPLVARDLKAALKHLGDTVPTNEVRRLIGAGRFREIHGVINFNHYKEILKKPFARIGDAYEAGAKLGARKINGAFGQARQRVRYRKQGYAAQGSAFDSGAFVHELFGRFYKAADTYNFDMMNEAVQEKIRAAQDTFIQQLEQDARDNIEQIVLQGTMDGLSPVAIVDDIQSLIGLTDTQSQAVLNFRNMLENLDPNALTRQLRNDDFDATVQQAIDDGTALASDSVDQMVQDYADNYLAYRAATIAQTESVRSINQGLHDAYSQAIERGVMPDSAVKREWQLGDSPCPVCESIPDNNPDGVGVDEDFDSDDGPISDPPVHPNCMCEVDYVTDISQIPDDTEDDSGSFDTADTQAEEFQ